MNKLLLTLGLSTLLTCGQTVQASAIQKSDFEGFTRSLVNRANSTGRQWTKLGANATPTNQQRVISQTENLTPTSSYWGSLFTPDGEEWMYTMQYTYANEGDYLSSISSALITIYDSNFNVYKTLTADFKLGEGETGINSVQISPTLTRKFFHINDAYEIMVMIHATTEDYAGHIYTQVYTLSDGSLVDTIEGDNIGAVNTATDPWSEKYTILFMRESTTFTDDDYEYMMYFDVYSKAGWGSGCKLEHTFEVNYKYFSGAGGRALPILMTENDNHVYYALPRYEKEFFASQFGDEVTPDNHFIVDLYDENFNLLKTTSMPMELEEGALFSFPGLGELRGNMDMLFEYNGKKLDYPVYVVGVENYVVSTDDYFTSLYVYDIDGNKIDTIVYNCYDYLQMAQIDGFEDQYCFYFAEDDGGYFKFIDVPSNTEKATIPLLFEEVTISTSIDRAAADGSYKYASSILVADVDKDENTIHRIAWFNVDGSFDRTDRINLGKNIAMAQVNILGEALNPFLFNTDDNIEYMFLVKQYTSSLATSSNEYLRIYNENSDLLLDLGKIEETGEYLSSIFMINTQKANPKLIVAYYANDQYTLHGLDLPLEKFGSGEGTKDSPYKITSAGDLMAIQTAPNAYYELAHDIDAKNMPWTGNKCNFTGVLDGKGYTIYNLNLVGQGIFSSVCESAIVKDLNIKGVTMNATNGGGIICSSLDGGDGKDKATLSNINIRDVNVIGSKDVVFGGLTGSATLYVVIENSSVTNAHYDFGDKSEVGGIVGNLITSSTVRNCLFDGWITASVAGGIAGTSWTGDETIANCHAHVEIDAYTIGGGIIGSSHRSLINNCFVDGNVNAVGSRYAYSGGIVGELQSSFADEKPVILKNCISAAKVTANAEAKDRVTHPIAGFTSGDEMLVDWDSDDPSIDWSDPSTYPYYRGDPEVAMRNNIALVADDVTAPSFAGANTAEGLYLTKEQLTDEVLAKYEWDMTNVWKRAGTALALVREDFSVSSDLNEITIYQADENDDVKYIVTFTCASRYAELMDVKSTDENIAKIAEANLSDDGRSVVCEVIFVNEGECDLLATLEDNYTKCAVKATVASIGDVIVANSISFDGNTLRSEGCTLSIYDIAGKLVATGYESISVSSLAKGTYVVTDGKTSIKVKK